MLSQGVSFIIPAFNEEKLLPQCLASINAEINRWHNLVDSETLFEVIVVDNNSTDNTKQIAVQAGAIVITEYKKGLTNARQAGYNLSKYEYQAYIDADNRIPLKWLDNIYELDCKSVVAISGPPYYENQSKLIKILANIFYMSARILHRYVGATIQGGNFIVKKQALDSIGGHSTDILFYGEDTDLAARLSVFGKIKLLPKMWIYSSDRRYTEQGFINTAFTYTLNYFTIHLLNRPVTKTYKDFRPEDTPIV
jgi:glycosyltransferase involved in cell wall biosynthesis